VSLTTYVCICHGSSELVVDKLLARAIAIDANVQGFSPESSGWARPKEPNLPERVVYWTLKQVAKLPGFEDCRLSNKSLFVRSVSLVGGANFDTLRPKKLRWGLEMVIEVEGALFDEERLRRTLQVAGEKLGFGSIRPTPSQPASKFQLQTIKAQ